MSAELIQGEAAWFAARCGKATASKIGDIVAKTKTGWGATRANYMALLIAERLTGKPADTFSNAAMQWGTEQEPLARKAYEDRTGLFVEQVGFIQHPKIPMSGASPDGQCGDDGLVEIKCPNTATHIDTLLGAEIDKKYLMQMQWQMACTDRKWCDFVSFDPRMPPAMQLHVVRVNRDEGLLAGLEKEVETFLAEVSVKVRELSEKYPKGAA